MTAMEKHFSYMALFWEAEISWHIYQVCTVLSFESFWTRGGVLFLKLKRVIKKYSQLGLLALSEAWPEDFWLGLPSAVKRPKI